MSRRCGWGWFSPTSARRRGYLLYRDVGGREVAVTEVCRARKKPGGVWPDQRYVGRVQLWSFRVGDGPRPHYDTGIWLSMY